MLSCDAAHRLLAHAADGDAGRPALDAHLASCPACRAAVVDQQRVAHLLRNREPEAVPLGFAARVSGRIDEESGIGLLDLADWRRWTFGLTPIAAALLLAVYLGAGVDSALDKTAATTPAAEASFDSWMASDVAGTPASVFLQPVVDADVLLETVLTGVVPLPIGMSGETNGR